MNTKLLHNLTYGMYVAATMDGERPTGCVINTCIQITSQNPVCAISMNRNNYTHDLILKNKRFSVSILSEATNQNVIAQFGFASGKDKNKFEGIHYEMQNGLPILRENCSAALQFEVVGTMEQDTHTVIFGRLTDTFEGDSTEAPMTYRYYHTVIKGSAPKNAPTYQPKEEPVKEEPKAEASVRYVCNICGYIYEGDITKEPDTFRCPVCGVTKDNFSLME